MRSMMINAIGPDQPGLVEKLTAAVRDAGANLADSRMVKLGGQFAMIVMAQGEAEVMTKLRDALASPQTVQPMTVHCVMDDEATPAASAGLPYELYTYSMDQPGIVHRFSGLMHRHGINIEELSTQLNYAPVSATPLFTMRMRIVIPASMPLAELRDELDALAGQMNCDCELQPLASA